MNLRVRGSQGVARPVVETFQAVAPPDTPSRAFTPGGAQGGSEFGAMASQDRQGFPGALPVAALRG